MFGVLHLQPVWTKTATILTTPEGIVHSELNHAVNLAAPDLFKTSTLMDAQTE